MCTITHEKCCNRLSLILATLLVLRNFSRLVYKTASHASPTPDSSISEKAPNFLTLWEMGNESPGCQLWGVKMKSPELLYSHQLSPLLPLACSLPPLFPLPPRIFPKKTIEISFEPVVISTRKKSYPTVQCNPTGWARIWCSGVRSAPKRTWKGWSWDEGRAGSENICHVEWKVA